MNEQYYEENQSEVKKYSNVDSVDQWKAIVMFVIGIIGLSLIFTIVWNIFDIFFELDSKVDIDKVYRFNAYSQCITYAIGTISVFAIIGYPTLKLVFSKIKNVDVYVKGITYGFILLFAQSIYSIISGLLFGQVDSNANQEALVQLTNQSPIILFLLTVVLAPIFEEIVYRYSLFGLIHKRNRYLAYLICLVIFGFIHFDFSCFSSTEPDAIKVELLNLPAYLLSGGILCYAYEKEDSLISSIVAHTTNNLIAFIQIIALFFNA